jgi:hypothetical protein
MERIGAAFTVMVVCVVPVQPFAAVPVTVYVCVAFGVKATPLETPLFQAYEFAPLAVSVADVPKQRVFALALMERIGAAFTVMVVEAHVALNNPLLKFLAK